MNNEITLNESAGTRLYDAGEVVDNERGCFNARCCFKIKNAAPKAMVFVLIFDLTLFCVVWIVIILLIGFSIKHSKEVQQPYIKLVLNSVGIYLPSFATYIMKIYYIIRWFRNGK